MTRPTLTAAAAGFLLALITTPQAAHADEVYTCTDRNTDLHFVIYEQNNTPSGGHMYVAGMQVAGLEVTRQANYLLTANISGNSAPTMLKFNSSRQEIYISINGSEKSVCQVRVVKS